MPGMVVFGDKLIEVRAGDKVSHEIQGRNEK